MPASYLDALNAVFKYLPENICPKQPLPPPRVVSLYEADSTPLPYEVPRLPFSPTVGGLVANLENSLSKVKGNKTRSTPSSFSKANAGKKFYAPHNSTWPVKPPPMDSDAGLVGVTGQAYPDRGAAKLLATLDSGLRGIVAMGSHIDLCLGAARKAGESPTELDALLQSSARAPSIFWARRWHCLRTSFSYAGTWLLVRLQFSPDKAGRPCGQPRWGLTRSLVGAAWRFQLQTSRTGRGSI